MILSDEHDFGHLIALNSGFLYESTVRYTYSPRGPFASQNNIVLQPAQ